MASCRNAKIDQGRSFSRPPLFRCSNFGHWKKLTHIFIRTTIMRFEDHLKGDFILTVKKDNKDIPMSRLKFTPEKIEKVTKNYKALNILFCGLDYNEFSHVSIFEIAKEVWDIFMTTCKGTSQVPKSKSSLYVHQYELFKTMPGASIMNMRIPLIQNNQ